jgi:DNA-binding SARP family transcriptional activator
LADTVEFGLLGPLSVRVNGEPVPIPRGKQRILLATLLLRPGRTVPADQLADVMWREGPPPSATITLQNYVKRLRQALGAVARDRVVTQPGGYLIRVKPGELDLAAMEQALAAARRAAREDAWLRAADEAAAALALWRGEPLCDVDLPLLAAPEVSRVAELRLQAGELRAEADLQLTRHAEVITDLEQLVADAPLREHLHALLMLALYRCGRRAEALEAYGRARDMLVEDLGSEPGPELQDLHRQILRDDPALLPLPASAPEATTQSLAVPQQLPAAVSCFTGRDAELAALSSLLDALPGTAAPALVISAIGGTAGVGKTALALHWAHQVAGEFADGQLYVNLRGYDPREPVAAADALAGFLRDLGVPGTEIPDSAEERAGLYRGKLAGRRVLVVLDNARDGEQIRPLLPGDPGCLAVVTSRDSLAGLVATDGAIRLDLDVLPLADAIELLRSLIGPRADIDPEAAADLAGLCARLPLALRITAELAAARCEVPLAELVRELQANRLDVLDAGEERADVRAVFSWSVRQLPADAADAFALAGLHPGQDMDVHAAAALAGTAAVHARRMLDGLLRASLLHAAGAGRYGMHDLLRTYARERAAARDPGDHRDQALTRLFEYYLATAAAAMDVLFPAEACLRPPVLPGSVVTPDLLRDGAARAWLDAERANLVAVVVHCAGHGWLRHAADLAGTLFRYLLNGGHLPEADTIFGHVLQAARRSGDLAAEGPALIGLGGTSILKGRFHEAAAYYQTALERYRNCGDRAGQARAVHNLGTAEVQLHNLVSAADYYRQAIAAYRDAGDSLCAARAMADLAAAETELGSYDEAAEHLQRALPVLRREKDQYREAGALSWSAEISLRRGQLAQAADLSLQSLTLYRRLENRKGAADRLTSLGQIGVRRAEYQQAIGYLRQALALFRQVGDQYGETVTLRTLAEALLGAGRPAEARAALEQALQLAAETGNTYQQACARRELAENYHSAGEDEHARHHWRQALDLYTDLGAPEAEQVRSRLGALETERAEPLAGQAAD